MCKAVLGTGFRGWFSVEVFDEAGKFGTFDDMQKYCKDARNSCAKLMIECANAE